MRIFLCLLSIPLALSWGLCLYADWKSVLLLCAAEYSMLFPFIYFACPRIAGGMISLRRAAFVILLTEAPTLVFPLMKLLGANAYVVSQTGMLTMTAGCVLVFYAVRFSFSGRLRPILAGLCACAFYALVSWYLSVAIVKPPIAERIYEAKCVQIPTNKYDPELNSFAKAPARQLLQEKFRRVDNKSSEFRILKTLLSDALASYYNGVPPNFGYYKMSASLLKYRAQDSAARKWDAQKLKAVFFISEILAVESPGVVEFRIRGTRRSTPADMENSPIEGAVEHPFDVSVNIYRVADTPDGPAAWTVCYIRSNAANVGGA